MMISRGWRRMGAHPCMLDSPARWSQGEARAPISWELARAAARRAAHHPVRRPHSGQCRGRGALGQALCGRRELGRGSEPGKEGRGQGAALRRGRPCRGSGNTMTPRPPRSRAIAGRQWPLRPLRGPLRPRDAHEPAHRARAGLPRGLARRALSPPPRRAPVELCRPADAAVLRRAADASRGGRPDLLEARGPVPYRRAQDQQCAGPGAPRRAHGQEAHHRRDGGGPARRRLRHRRRAARPRLRGVHG